MINIAAKILLIKNKIGFSRVNETHYFDLGKPNVVKVKLENASLTMPKKTLKNNFANDCAQKLEALSQCLDALVKVSSSLKDVNQGISVLTDSSLAFMNSYWSLMNTCNNINDDVHFYLREIGFIY